MFFGEPGRDLVVNLDPEIKIIKIAIVPLDLTWAKKWCNSSERKYHFISMCKFASKSLWSCTWKKFCIPTTISLAIHKVDVCRPQSNGIIIRWTWTLEPTWTGLIFTAKMWNVMGNLWNQRIDDQYSPFARFDHIIRPAADGGMGIILEWSAWFAEIP